MSQTERNSPISRSLPTDISQVVSLALAEDIGSGDLTTSLVAADALARAAVIAREQAVICGRPWFDEVFRQLDASIAIEWMIAEGQPAEAGQTICRLSGAARPLLTGERTALNFLQTLSATATTAKTFADAVSGTKCQILDTRKTIPGLRSAQKYAVACGGAMNHRLGLFDAILIKENHIAAAGSVAAAITQARAISDLPIQIEVENLEQLDQALAANADSILLDNFSNALLAEAVIKTRTAGGKTRLEASGGYQIEQLEDAAKTGVDFISSGALTKNLRAIDFSMRFKFRETADQ
ncbi:MAG: carboxylating nicotinate-nucleotide diphosphorylase [Gammaproteobacteria bacterium]|nr:carboxylating nicotinate-nucleotide diphosphorylase [Gammaproteobacteria bacterium]